MITRELKLFVPDPGRTVVTSPHWKNGPQAMLLDQMRTFSSWDRIEGMVQVTLEDEKLDIFLAHEPWSVIGAPYYVWATVLITRGNHGNRDIWYPDIWYPGVPGSHLGPGFGGYFSSVGEFKDQLLIDSI